MINQPQSIIHKLPGHLIPSALLETASKVCPTVSGFAVRDKEGDANVLSVEKTDKSIQVSDLEKLNTATKDSELVLYMANMPGEHTADDIQPFTVTIFADEKDEVGTDILSVFVEGDFPTYSKPDSGHTDEYNFYEEYLMPKLGEIFEDCKQDIAAFVARLHKPSFEKDVKAQAGHRCALVFLPIEGDAVKFGNNEDLGRGYDWGTTSQHHNWDAKKEEKKPITNAAAAVSDGVKKVLFGKKPPVGGEPTGPKLPDGVHAVPPKVTEPPKTDTAINAGKVQVQVPKKLEGKARNRWIRLFNNGKLPENHVMQDLKIWVDPGRVEFTKRDVKTSADIDMLEEEIRTGAKKEQPKDMKTAEPVKVEDKKSSPADFLPTLDDKEMSEATQVLANFLDREKAPSPLDIQKMEAPWPTFSNKFGIPFTDMYRLTVHDWNQFDKKALILALLEFKYSSLKNSQIKLEDLVGTAKEVKQVGNTTIVKEIPPQQSKTAGEKRALIWGKKSAA